MESAIKVGSTIQTVSSRRFPLISDGTGFLLRLYRITNHIITRVMANRKTKEKPTIK